MASSDTPAIPPPPGEVSNLGNPQNGLHSLTLGVDILLFCLIAVSFQKHLPKSPLRREKKHTLERSMPVGIRQSSHARISMCVNLWIPLTPSLPARLSLANVRPLCARSQVRSRGM